MLNWVNRFNICAFLDNHHYDSDVSGPECLVGAGVEHFLSAEAGTAFSQLQKFHEQHYDWIFGHLSYDLKNESEKLYSKLPDHIGFSDLFFFIPQVVLLLSKDQLLIGVDKDHERIFAEINQTKTKQTKTNETVLNILQRFNKAEYMQSVALIKEHIHAGDCYELNFCQEFYVEEVVIEPMHTYLQLSKTSPNPFSAFYKLNGRFVICASPERYLRNKGGILLSQPIKGTKARESREFDIDESERTQLLTSEKDRSENVMIVDLVRNDLSRVCEKGTVEVKELFGIYTFPHVHQMISSVTGKLRKNTTVEEILRATFPMGSMTGAPKKKVLELIEQFEKTKRGLFSGSIGYMTPEGDFDFNVVIRSVMYNQQSGYLSFQTGSAITFYSDPEEEYNECLLKAAAIKKVLTKVNTF